MILFRSADPSMVWALEVARIWLIVFGCAAAAWAVGFGIGYRRGVNDAINGRRTAVVHLSRAGCSVPEIAAITGDSVSRTVSILEVYLPRDSEMAAAAIAKLDAWRRQKSAAKPA
jgi:hypothetical protein